jgi:hypothetical protein
VRPYHETIETLAPDYSTFGVRDERGDWPPKTESQVIPGADLNYTLLLDERPADFTTVVVTVDGDPIDLIPFSDAPGENQAAFDPGDPARLRFDSSREGQTALVDFQPAERSRSAQDVNQLRVNDADLDARVMAVEDALLASAGGDVRQLPIAGSPGDADDLLARTCIVSETTRKLKRVSLFAKTLTGLSPTLSDVTEIRVTPESTNTGGVTISLPCTGTTEEKQWATVECDVDLVPTDGMAKLNAYCVDPAGNHQNLTVEVTIQ